MTIRLTGLAVERWPIAGSFTISRGAKTEAVVVVVRVSDGVMTGRGESVPYARYGETVEGVCEAIEEAAASLADLTPSALIDALPAGAARNALDCALIDLTAKRAGLTAAGVLGVNARATPLLTCYTLSLAAPDAMAEAALRAMDKPLLKLKLGGGLEDAARLRAVRKARPDVRLVADANEAWSVQDLEALMTVAAEVGLEVIEQPLPAGADDALRQIAHLVPICADESAHTADDLPALAGLYDAVNIKLDKAGGLTSALIMASAARQGGFKIMTGCMLATSLAMAPAWLVAGLSDWIDLDGPLLLARDREPGVVYAGGMMHPPPAHLWG